MADTGRDTTDEEAVHTDVPRFLRRQRSDVTRPVSDGYRLINMNDVTFDAEPRDDRDEAAQRIPVQVEPAEDSVNGVLDTPVARQIVRQDSLCDHQDEVDSGIALVEPVQTNLYYALRIDIRIVSC
nr:hypothetical protein BaRGS_020597 [Batillaria attramentaria]